jgi:BirA family transcriptional regulator, biotin operon repressor / biotin---[acetyl-CoA-carboxylase] ligase
VRTENHTPGQATSPSSPSREPLDAASLRRALLRPGGLWQAVEVVDRTGSTNADLLARALGGAPEGVLLAAEEQSAGRGRMGRAWVSPPRAALTFSLLVRPAAVPPARRGWLPLLAGVAVATAVTAVTGVQTRLKWPNDVLTGPAKLAGILAEAIGDAVVVGVGLNVATEPGELPPAGPGALSATSLRIAASAAPEVTGSAAPEVTGSAAPEVTGSAAPEVTGSAAPEVTGSAAPAIAVPAREPLLIAILGGFERWYLAWCRAGGDPDRCGLRAGYTELSGTIGRRVRAELPGGQMLSGLAVGVDPDGRLLVRVSSATVLPVAAGDVVHLR